MRDRRFVAEHRGGPLKPLQHRQLTAWACRCAEHVLLYFCDEFDPKLQKALDIAKKWIDGEASVGEARKAALGAIAVANRVKDPASVAVARSVGHAVATAHMADHSLGAALYALKAVEKVGGSVEAEKYWQNAQLPPESRVLIFSARKKRKGMR